MLLMRNKNQGTKMACIPWLQIHKNRNIEKRMDPTDQNEIVGKIILSDFFYFY